MNDLTDLEDYSQASSTMNRIVFAIVRNKNKKLRDIGRLIWSLEITRDDPQHPIPDVGVLWDILMKIKTTATMEDEDDDLNAGE
jgi:hypothetical protein